MEAAKPTLDPDPRPDPLAGAVEPSPAKRDLALSALGVSVTSALNILLGFGFQIVLTALFGTSLAMDAYVAASTIPLILTAVLFGSLNVTFVPVFIEYQVHGRSDDAWVVVSGFLILCLVGLGALCAGLALFAEPIIRLTTPGFEPGSERFTLTVDLFRLLLPSVVIGGVAMLLRNFYHAQRRFILAAWAPTLNTLLMVLGTLALAGQLGVTAVAIGTLLGSIAQFGLLAPALLRSGKLTLAWNALRHPGVQRILILMAPWVLSAVFSQSNSLIDRFLASQLEVGAISALGYADRLRVGITMVLTQGISVVLFPLMAEHAARGDHDRLRTVAARGVRLTTILAIPFVVLLLILGEPIVAMLFERGQFDADATRATALALVAYLGALFATCLGSVLTFAFYASQDTLSVALTAIVGFVINIAAAVWLTPLFGVAGPALAFSITALFNLLVLTLVLRRRLGGFELDQLGVVFLKSFGAAALAALIWGVARMFAVALPTGSLQFTLLIGSATVLGLAAFVGAGFALGLTELRLFGAQLAGRIARLRNRS
jgi:putative peptidoglycan lipid II flippase